MSYSKPSWAIPEAGFPFASTFHRVEKFNGLPRNLLARIAYRESRFRPDVINGITVSRAGAVGIMQIVPKWHPDVNPYDPIESIEYAGRFMKYLIDQNHGNIALALASYNWGLANVRKNYDSDKGKFRRMPSETRDYVRVIMADLDLPQSVA